jgi:hypothetical protein
MFAARALRDLLRRLRGDHPPSQRIQRQRQWQTQASRRGNVFQDAAHGVLHDARRTHSSAIPSPCAARVNRTPGQRSSAAGAPAMARQPLHAAPPGTIPRTSGAEPRSGSSTTTR